MKYYSTQNKKHIVSLKEAVLKGLPQDNGLYMPQSIPRLADSFYNDLPKLSLPQIAFEVSKIFFGEDVSDADLKWIVEDAISFDAPLVHIHDNIYSLELFHGPTLAFKDFGARFMSRLMSKLITKNSRKVHILVATSGDTGSAVAQGFYQVDGIHVTILYPSGKVSKIQEQQIATLDQNITTLEIDGTFDDCQHLVKTAFLDHDLQEKLTLSSANSINVARFIPQSFYYFYALGQLLQKTDLPAVISVPSGNFGNLTGGIFAHRMGLHIDHFIAAVNANDTFPKYLKSGLFEPKPSVKTISNAMDVGNPSNLGRIIDLYNDDVAKMRKDISSWSFTDQETQNWIKRIKDTYGYVLDPHGAIGYAGLQRYMLEKNKNTAGIIFETAHPAKFKDTVDEIINENIDVPDRLAKFADRPKTSVCMKAEFDEFKEYLLSLA